jgi:aryl-alcohol dehydrogenase-like predicted oxidoreductase
LVLAGKVLYLGVSDTPAWVVVKANDYARHHGLTPFSLYQGKWSAGFRDLEAEVIPMCRDQGMALAPWEALGGGKLLSAEQREEKTDGRPKQNYTADQIKICDELERIAKDKSTSVPAVVSHLPHSHPTVNLHMIRLWLTSSTRPPMSSPSLVRVSSNI